MRIHHIQYMRKRYGGSETYLDNIERYSRFSHTVGFAQDVASGMTDKDPVFLKTYYDFKAKVRKPHLSEYDVIHSHFIIPGLFAQQEGFSSVCSSHCLFSKEFKMAIHDADSEKEKRELEQAHSFFKYFESEFYPKIDHLIVHSPYHKMELEDLGAKPSLLKLPLDINFFDCGITQKEARKEMNIPDKFTILFLGRPTYLKGFHVLAKAFDSFYRKNDSQLLIVGDFDKKDKLLEYFACVRGNSSREACVKTDVEGEMIIRNNISREQVPLCFKSADVLVCPSLYEAIGYVNLEAMASKIPVIGSNTGGIPSILLDGKTGLLFEPGNSVELEKRLCEIRENPLLIREMTSNAWEFVQQFEVSKTIRELDRLYEEIFG